jgi:beta-1,4-N-acetylglucosaminyltransferase
MTEAFDDEYEANRKPSKVCFVTIGATASFDKLLKAVLERSFLEALYDAEYTDLVIQYGKEGGKAIYDRFISTDGERVKQNGGPEITGFDFNTNGLGQEMRKTKGDPRIGSKEGLVVSHAGWKPKSLPRWNWC